MKLSALVAGCGALLTIVAVTSPAPAQTAAPQLPYGIGDAVREGEQTRRAPLPGAPAAPVLPQLVEPQLMLKDKETLFVRRFKVEGPSLADDAEVRAILAPYENRKLTLAKIYEAADALTAFYRARGYVVAKVYVPAQNARDGVLRITFVPGKHGAITVRNQSLVRDGFVHGVINQALSRSPYIEKNTLERAMLLTSDLAGAGVPRVVVGPGQRPETTDFVFDVPQTQRFDGYLLGDNYGSPFTGRNRLSGALNVNSPLGFGDRLSAFGIVSDDSGLLNGRVAYSLPVGTDGLRAEAAAFRTTYVLNGIYSGLGATGTGDGITGTLTYAMRRQQEESIYLWSNFTHKALNDKIFDISFADRSINLGTAGLTRDTFGAFAGLPLTTNTVLSVTIGRVTFNDALQEAMNIAGADTVGNYVRANLAFTSTLAFNEKLSLSTNFRAQKSFGKNLDSSEQMGLTGVWGVRSYDEGFAGDSGYLVTPELKYALPDVDRYRHSISAFTDVGGVWLANSDYTTTQKPFTQLNDVGLGYYATYEYLPGRFLLLKAHVAHTYGSDGGAQTYNRGTKGLLQIGGTF
jgi:hemolysin activation/secretion protein